jgi:hypothetical protein
MAGLPRMGTFLKTKMATRGLALDRARFLA